VSVCIQHHNGVLYVTTFRTEGKVARFHSEYFRSDSSTVIILVLLELTTFTSPLIMAFSHELQPFGPIVFSGPLQPSTQFSWQGWHSPDASYLLVGQTGVQKGPSLTCLQSVQLPGPGP
jgi:hypothetical protein